MNSSGFFSLFDRSAYVGRPFGIPIRLHITILFFLLPALRGGFGLGYELEFALGLVLSILLHELGHALTARRYGLTGLSITLHGFGGFAVSRGARTPRQSLVIALAGPAATFATGFVLIGLGRAGESLTAFGSAASIQSFLIEDLGRLNVLLGFLNLVPVLPWDGGQALQAIFAHRVSEIKAMRHAAHIGLLVALGLLVYGLLMGGPFFGLFAFVGLLTCYATLANSGGIRFDEAFKDRRSRKELEAVRRREEARTKAYLSEVGEREREREEKERLRKMFEG